MANEKELAAVFESQIKTPAGTQSAITIVFIPVGSHNWTSIVFSTDGHATPSTTSDVYVHYASVDILKTANDKNILTKIYQKAKIHSDPRYECSSKDVTLISKIDEALSKKSSWLRSASLNRPDSTASTNTIQQYIMKNFNVDPNLFTTTTKQVTPSFPVAYPRRNIDWSITWNSPFLTDAEKATLHRDFDADIAYSNSTRDCRKIFEKAMFTTKFSTKYTAIALHGNPGGGKSKMVLNDFCAMYDIPVIHITCDQLMTISTFFSVVEPVNRETILNGNDSTKLKTHLKDHLSSLQTQLEQEKKQININTDIIQKLEGQIHDTLESLDKLNTLSSTAADLMRTSSILFKCLKYNLPVVAFLDEFILTSTQFQNALSPIISDGTYKAGTTIGYNDFTVLWVFAWNPNTTNVKSWDQKFFDRTRFIQVEDLPRKLLTEYKINKTLVGMNKAKGITVDFTHIDQLISNALSNFPQYSDTLLTVQKIAHQANGCQQTIEWFVSKRIAEITHTDVQSFNPGDFSMVYLDDVVCGTNDETKAAITSIDDLTVRINNELYTLTRGKDSKNPDRNSYFYISDRSMESFIDTLVCYRDVHSAVRRFIVDLIPGGNTIKLGGGNADKSSYEDETPNTIADSVVNKLANPITDLNTKLFVNITPTAIVDAQQAIKNSSFSLKLWPAKASTPSNSTATTQNTVSPSIIDQADQLIG